MEITQEVRDSIIDHALETAPLECCGFLIGPPSDPGCIDSMARMPNASRSPTRFSIDPPHLIDCFRRVRSSGQRLAGMYHSHPTSPAHPSSSDISQFHYHSLSYWIVSLLSPDAPNLRCFVWQDGGFIERVFSVRSPLAKPAPIRHG